ncbi:DnaJ domain-containing protein [Chloroflexota bacterium]
MQTEQYEVNWKDYYNILEQRPTANAQDIKSAYRRLARKYHPDRAEDSPAPDRMAEVNEAYEVLSHPDRRAKYDETFRSSWQLTEEDALDAELKDAMARLAREQRRYRRMERPAGPIRTNILLDSFLAWMECLMVPVPLSSAWLVYLLMVCIILLRLL